VSGHQLNRMLRTLLHIVRSTLESKFTARLSGRRCAMTTDNERTPKLYAAADGIGSVVDVRDGVKTCQNRSVPG
jgi:hypothetical protein